MKTKDLRLHQTIEIPSYRYKELDVITFHLVFVERIGCFFVESKPILAHQVPSPEIVWACSSVAWSLSLKVFAVRNGSECLGDKHLPSLLPRLNASKECFGGRGGKNMSDVYRLTSKEVHTLDCYYSSI